LQPLDTALLWQKASAAVSAAGNNKQLTLQAFIETKTTTTKSLASQQHKRLTLALSTRSVLGKAHTVTSRLTGPKKPGKPKARGAHTCISNTWSVLGVKFPITACYAAGQYPLPELPERHQTGRFPLCYPTTPGELWVLIPLLLLVLLLARPLSGNRQRH
jgi:hypothetical protein